MQPEHRIKGGVIKLSHVPYVPANLSVDRIVDIFKAGVGTWFVNLPYVIAKGRKILVVGIIHQNIDRALEARELRGHGVKNLVFFGRGLDRCCRAGIPEGCWPFVVLLSF